MRPSAISLYLIVLFLFGGTFSACGSSSDSSGQLFEGRLIEAGGSNHAKHSAGQPIEEVTICALERCGVTDAEGQWGFIVPEFSTSKVKFSVIGHGIDTSLEVDVPSTGRDYFFEFRHVHGGAVVAEGISVDGEPLDHD